MYTRIRRSNTKFILYKKVFIKNYNTIVLIIWFILLMKHETQRYQKCKPKLKLVTVEVASYLMSDYLGQQLLCNCYYCYGNKES